MNLLYLSKLFFQKFTIVSAIRYSSFRQQSGVERIVSGISQYRVSNNFNAAKRKNATSIIHHRFILIFTFLFFYFPFSPLFILFSPQSHFPRGIYFSKSKRIETNFRFSLKIRSSQARTVISNTNRKYYVLYSLFFSFSLFFYALYLFVHYQRRCWE